MDKTPSSRDYPLPKACPFCARKLFVVFFNTARNPHTMGIHGWECLSCHSTFAIQAYDILPKFSSPDDGDVDNGDFKIL